MISVNEILNITDNSSLPKALIDNFELLHNIDCIYIMDNFSEIYHTKNIPKKWIEKIGELDIKNIILNHLYTDDNFFMSLGHKYFTIYKKVNIELKHKYCNYLIFVFEKEPQKNIKNIDDFTKLFELKINYFLYRKKVHIIESFNKTINDVFNNDFYKSDDDTDDFLQKVLGIMCTYFNMTCAHISENRNNRYYPFVSYATENAQCLYGLYDFEISDPYGPWPTIHTILNQSHTNYVYLYDVPEKFSKYFINDNMPKTVYALPLEYRDINILFTMSNNHENIDLDDIALVRIEIIFHILYEIICQKAMYKKNKAIERLLKGKLRKWEQESKQVASDSFNLIKNLQSMTK